MLAKRWILAIVALVALAASLPFLVTIFVRLMEGRLQAGIILAGVEV